MLSGPRRAAGQPRVIQRRVSVREYEACFFLSPVENRSRARVSGTVLPICQTLIYTRVYRHLNLVYVPAVSFDKVFAFAESEPES